MGGKVRWILNWIGESNFLTSVTKMMRKMMRLPLSNFFSRLTITDGNDVNKDDDDENDVMTSATTMTKVDIGENFRSTLDPPPFFLFLNLRRPR